MVNSDAKAAALSFPWRFTKSVWQETQTGTTRKLEAGASWAWMIRDIKSAETFIMVVMVSSCHLKD
jgi:hypothetical protein